MVFTQGDYAVLNLTATDGNGNPVNLAGLTINAILGCKTGFDGARRFW